MDHQRKDHHDPKRRPKINHPKKLLTHILLTNEVENFNETRKTIYDSQIVQRLFTKELKECHKGIRRTDLQYINLYILKDSKTRKKECSYDVEWH